MKVKSKTLTEKVYEVTKKIPKGSTLTYKQVAIKVGHPNAARAIGTILSKNFNKDIPCHRVIRSNGKMGGYNRGGVAVKEKILDQEKI
jgi:O-6-methylguanine DNA methyltransferase